MDEEQQPIDNELDQSREDEKAHLNKRESKEVKQDSSTSNGGANHGNSEFKVENVVVQQLSQERMTPNSGSSNKKTKGNAVAPYQMNESGMTNLTHGGPLENVQVVDQNRTESALLMPPMSKDVSPGQASGADDGVLDNRNSSAGTTNEHFNETRGRHTHAASDQSKNLLSETADRPLLDGVVSAAFDERRTSNGSRANKQQRRDGDDTIVTDERRLTKENFNDTIEQQEE